MLFGCSGLFSAEEAPPAGKTEKELTEAIQNVIQTHPTLLGAIQLSEEERAVLQSLLEDCDALLSKGPGADLKKWAASVKVRALLTRFQITGSASKEQLQDCETTIAILEEDEKLADFVKQATFRLLRFQLTVLTNPNNGGAVDPRQLRDAIKRFAANDLSKEADVLTKHLVELAKRYARQDQPFVVETFREFGELYSNSKDGTDTAFGKKLLGLSRRYDLPGNTMSLSGKAADSRNVSLADFKNKVVLIEFWTTWCGPCMEALPTMRDYYAEYREKGFEIIGINEDQNLKGLQKFLEKESMPWVVICDIATGEQGGTRIADQFGVGEYPTMILIGRNGKVIATDFDQKFLARELPKLFAGTPSNTGRKEIGLDVLEPKIGQPSVSDFSLTPNP